jgi:hypothetical protein
MFLVSLSGGGLAVFVTTKADIHSTRRREKNVPVYLQGLSGFGGYYLMESRHLVDTRSELVGDPLGGWQFWNGMDIKE